MVDREENIRLLNACIAEGNRKVEALKDKAYDSPEDLKLCFLAILERNTKLINFAFSNKETAQTFFEVIAEARPDIKSLVLTLDKDLNVNNKNIRI